MSCRSLRQLRLGRLTSASPDVLPGRCCLLPPWQVTPTFNLVPMQMWKAAGLTPKLVGKRSADAGTPSATPRYRGNAQQQFARSGLSSNSFSGFTELNPKSLKVCSLASDRCYIDPSRHGPRCTCTSFHTYSAGTWPTVVAVTPVPARAPWNSLSASAEPVRTSVQPLPVTPCSSGRWRPFRRTRRPWRKSRPRSCPAARVTRPRRRAQTEGSGIPSPAPRVPAGTITTTSSTAAAAIQSPRRRPRSQPGSGRCVLLLSPPDA